MRNPILRLIGVRSQTGGDMLVVCAAASLAYVTRSPTIVDMSVAIETFAHEVTHHWSALIVRSKSTAVDLHHTVRCPFYGPSGLGHRTMACFMLLLRVALN